VGKLVFKEMLENLWLIEFSYELDKQRVLKGRPWLSYHSVLVSKDVDEGIPHSLRVFTSSPFSVKIHEMPLVCMSREIGQKIGSTLGMVEEVDVSWGRCLRIRIHLDVTRPLERERALVLSGKSIWVPFRYEKLP